MPVEMERHLLEELLQLTELVVVACAAVAAWCTALVLAALLLRLRQARQRFDGSLYAIAAPAGSGVAEHVFRSLHGILRPVLERLVSGQPWISLEIVGRGGRVRFQIWLPSSEKAVLESLLRASYPGVELAPVEDPTAAQQRGVARARLAHDDFLPLRTTFEGEPLSNVLWSLARAQAGEEIALQLLVRPKPSRWQLGARREAERLREGRRGWIAILPGVPAQVTPSRSDKNRAKAIEEKASDVGFDCVLRVAAAATQPATIREYVRAMAVALAPYSGANGLALGGASFRRRAVESFEERRFLAGGDFVLTVRELAALWHMPSAEAAPHLEVLRSPKLRPPDGADRGERLLGTSTWAAERRPVALSVADSRYHLHLLGSTGTGKTTAMLNLAAQDIAAGRGVAVLDPKGDLVQGLLARLPKERMEEVVLISPEDAERSVGINPLELWRATIVSSSRTTCSRSSSASTSATGVRARTTS